MSERARVVKYLDPRITLPELPTFGVPVGAKAINPFRVPASALGASTISFNNLVVLGRNQMYSNTFQLETTFHISMTVSGSDSEPAKAATTPAPDIVAGLRFKPFPLNSITDQYRININGQNFSSQPAYLMAARMRYMKQEDLTDAYINQCPCIKPMMQDEMGIRDYTDPLLPPQGRSMFGNRYASGTVGTNIYRYYNEQALSFVGSKGLFNGVPEYSAISGSMMTSQTTERTFEFDVTFTEPIFCSPFASRLDANYGSPITGIQTITIDLTYNTPLRIIMANLPWCTNLNVTINSCTLLYDVITLESVPEDIGPTFYPYRDIVPFVTEQPDDSVYNNTGTGYANASITSGVYTINTIPQAIWIWIGPTRGTLQSWNPNTPSGTIPFIQNTREDLFQCITHVNISMGNTTQILNNCSQLDLYRIAKANGNCDTFRDFCYPQAEISPLQATKNNATLQFYGSPGAGTVLRLIPGRDLIMNDRDLIPGTGSENIVFQVTVDYMYHRQAANSFLSSVWRQHALWVCFEYSGILMLHNGMGRLFTQPLEKQIIDAAPTIRVGLNTIPDTPIGAEGGAFWDTLKNAFTRGVKWLRDNKMISRVAKMIPHPVSQGVGQIADSLGFGDPAADLPLQSMQWPVRAAASEIRTGKRPRSGGAIAGGAIMGLGDFC